jgi:hypothetical protein
MFVANISLTKCATIKGYTTNFPNPGDQIQIESPLNYPLRNLIGEEYVASIKNPCTCTTYNKY